MTLEQGLDRDTILVSSSPSLSSKLLTTLHSVYTEKEFLEKWGDIPGAEYLLMYRPEICKHKDILEKIRNTRRVDSMTLEGEGSEGYVVQISDICLKFMNSEQEKKANFQQELNNYKLIESIYLNTLGENSSLKIPQLQRELSDDTTIAMEYIPGFTLAHLYTLKENSVQEKELVKLLENSEDDDIVLIQQRLEGDYSNVFTRLKDHELRTLLVGLGISTEEIENNGALDTIILLEGVISGQEKKNTIEGYRVWKKALQDAGIISIDDHGENFKIYNNCLYSLDFGNITFSS